MKTVRFLVAFLGIAVALGLGTLTYIDKLKPGDIDPLFYDFLLHHKPALALWIFAFSTATVVLNPVREYLTRRNEPRVVAEKLLSVYAKQLFGNQVMINRLTLFKRYRGWVVWGYALFRQHVTPWKEQWPKWRALFNVNLSAYYLCVYLRPTRAWNRESVAAFRISEDPSVCAGVAGMIWRNNSLFFLTDLPKIDSLTVRSVKTLSNLDKTHDVRVYAEKTNVRDICILKARSRFALHFLGTVIETSAGERWGVLLLDSEDESCPLAFGDRMSEYRARFEDCALTLGKVLS